ncbi:ORF6N domain-containing protein [Niabella soli]|nr:ORF6N domain-containing protein [Niabella soli]
MLDFDLAILYEVETKRLNEAVKRNIERFPASFMFRLTVAEWEKMRSQFATASGQNKRNTKVTPFAFTEHGVTMLAGVLKSEKAIKVNIAIVEAFVALKKFAFEHKDLTEKLKRIERKYNKQFKDIYEALNYLLKKDKIETAQKQRVRIGFKTSEDL